MGKIMLANSKLLRQELFMEAVKKSQEPAEQQVGASKKRTRKPKNEKTNCSCKANMETCPLGVQCLKDKLVYREKLEDQNDNKEFFTGLTAGTLKKRLYGHNANFRKKGEKLVPP